MVSTSPVRATTKPAPAQRRISRTVMRNCSGAPSFFGSSLKLYWVLAMHTGSAPKPSSVSAASCSAAWGVKSAPSAP